MNTDSSSHDSTPIQDSGSSLSRGAPLIDESTSTNNNNNNNTNEAEASSEPEVTRFHDIAAGFRTLAPLFEQDPQGQHLRTADGRPVPRDVFNFFSVLAGVADPSTLFSDSDSGGDEPSSSDSSPSEPSSSNSSRTGNYPEGEIYPGIASIGPTVCVHQEINISSSFDFFDDDGNQIASPFGTNTATTIHYVLEQELEVFLANTPNTYISDPSYERRQELANFWVVPDEPEVSLFIYYLKTVPSGIEFERTALLLAYLKDEHHLWSIFFPPVEPQEEQQH